MEAPKSKDPQKELEIALSELEERVDRLRASYEQYFMGYEKLEPGVQRKDVDRRFTILRKQQIRNTALRFRFNVVTQKFNTYSMYWTRICRQIEEGTYKRHVAKAARRFGPKAANKREQEWSIDVDLGDFDDADGLEAALAEANAAAEAYGRDEVAADTIPPGARSEPPAAPPRRSPLTTPTPGTSFAMGGGRETIDYLPPGSEPPHHDEPRAARHAPLPPGGRQPVVVRRRPDEAPPSTPNVARGGPLSAGGPPASTPNVARGGPLSAGGPPASTPNVARGGPPSAGGPPASTPNVARGGPPSAPRIAVGGPAREAAGGPPASTPNVARGGPPSTPRIAVGGPAREAAGGPPRDPRAPMGSRPGVRPPAASSPDHPPSSTAAMRVAPASAPGDASRPYRPAAALAAPGDGAPPSARRIPAAAPASSTGSLPAAARSSGNIQTPPSPMTPRAPTSSQARIATSSAQPAPYRPAALPPSANRLPVAPAAPSAPRTPVAPLTPVGRPPPSSARVPLSPGPPPRAPTPSVPDAEPQSRRSPALPSETKKG
ncbi:MAG: hypothetical protein KF894_10430 [Labilithrix sp.]|nr:hypothetical protein [Labilithrix sp.]